VFVPEIVGGFFPVCPAAVIKSVLTPAVVTEKPENVWKSSRS